MSWSEACFLALTLLCLVLFLQRAWQLRRSGNPTRQPSPPAHLSPNSNLDRNLSDFEAIIRLPSNCDPAKLSDLRAKLLYDGGVTSYLPSKDQGFSRETMTLKIGQQFLDSDVEMEWVWRIWRWATSSKSPRDSVRTVTNLGRLRVFVGDSIVDILNDATCICEARSAVPQVNQHNLGEMIIELHSMDEEHRYRIISFWSP